MTSSNKKFKYRVFCKKKEVGFVEHDGHLYTKYFVVPFYGMYATQFQSARSMLKRMKFETFGESVPSDPPFRTYEICLKVQPRDLKKFKEFQERQKCEQSN